MHNYDASVSGSISPAAVWSTNNSRHIEPASPVIQGKEGDEGLDELTKEVVETVLSSGQHFRPITEWQELKQCIDNIDWT
jgi:hypothetical protein